MQEEEKTHGKYLIVKLTVYFILSACVFFFRETLVLRLKYFIGALMVIYGAEEFIFELIFYGKNFWKREKIFLGIIEFMFGVFLLFAPIEADTTCVIWATWSIIRESYEIRELNLEVKSKTLTLISGVESVAVIVLSFILILDASINNAMIHLYLLILELILTPLVPLLDEFFYN